VFRDGPTAAVSDQLAAQFVNRELGDLSVGRTDIVGGGEVVINHVTDALVAPTGL
jgi:hypothetical protein